MPLHPGLWQPPPARQEVTQGYGSGGLETILVYREQVENDFGGTWTGLIDTLSIGGIAGADAGAESGNILHLLDPTISLEQWAISQWVFDLDISNVGPVLPAPPLPWPAGAVGYEYDTPTPDPCDGEVILDCDAKVRWQIHVSDVSPGSPENIDVAFIANPVDLTGVPFVTSGLWRGFPRWQNVTYTALQPLPVIGTGALGIGDTDVVFETSDVNVVDYVVSDDIGHDIATIRVAVSFANMRNGVEPPLPGPGPVEVLRIVDVDYAGYTVTWQPPRWRFLYDVALPQRQFPRDDGLGISTRRSWPPPTSTQFSQRRGPNATYQ